LGDNTAQVYADTTLNGISGQEIRFQNTDTYRYQEHEIDPDTGKLMRSGVTREISSGLIVSLAGWASGGDMITMQVNATVSKQNNNAQGDRNSIPSTSERIINTQIRTPSGKPIILSGLMKEDREKNSGTGWLFKDKYDIKKKTEIVIYLVPYLVRDTNEESLLPLRLEQYYNRFMKNGVM
jgi:type II secretory pathway component GspD/PulD (secretin)